MCVELKDQNVDFTTYLVLQKIIFILTCFANIILVYLITFYSSRHMKEYKYILLVHIFCFIVHDFVICICLCPRTYPEVWAIRQMGLSADFSMSIQVSAFLTSSAIAEVIGSYTHMLFFRTRVIITEAHPLYFNKVINSLCTISVYSSWIVAVVNIYQFTAVDRERKYSQLQFYQVCEKNYGLLLESDDVLIVPHELTRLAVFMLSFGITAVIAVFLICFFVSTHTLYNSHSYLSRRTVLLQRSLLFALFLQVIIPVLLMAMPVLIVVISPPQEIEIVAFLLYAAHGLLNAIILIFAHRDYRKVVSVWFQVLLCSRSKKEQNKITCINKSESGSQYRVNTERL